MIAMQLWLIIHHVDDQQNHCVCKDLISALREIKQYWGPEIACEMGRQVVEAACKDDRASEAPISVSVIIPEVTDGRITTLNTMLEIRQLNTSERMWFGTVKDDKEDADG